jgi:hypothetical protein
VHPDYGWKSLSPYTMLRHLVDQGTPVNAIHKAFLNQIQEVRNARRFNTPVFPPAA